MKEIVPQADLKDGEAVGFGFGEGVGFAAGVGSRRGRPSGFSAAGRRATGAAWRLNGQR
jgi:hypothetical protein